MNDGISMDYGNSTSFYFLGFEEETVSTSSMFKDVL